MNAPDYAIVRACVVALVGCLGFAIESVAATPALVSGKIVAAKVTGVVTIKTGNRDLPLPNNDAVAVGATVRTGPQASVVLVFANGAAVQLSGDTEMAVDEFAVEPDAVQVGSAAAPASPRVSRTKLRFLRGELVGRINPPLRAGGSVFVVETPVGALTLPPGPVSGTPPAAMRIVPMASATVPTLQGIMHSSFGGVGGAGFRTVFRPTGVRMTFVFWLSVLGEPASFSSASGQTIVIPAGDEISVTVSVSAPKP